MTLGRKLIPCTVVAIIFFIAICVAIVAVNWPSDLQMDLFSLPALSLPTIKQVAAEHVSAIASFGSKPLSFEHPEVPASILDLNFSRTELAWKVPSGEPRILFSIFTTSRPEYAVRLHACLHTWASPSQLDGSELQIVGRKPMPGVRARWVLADTCPDNHGTGVACKEAHILAGALAANADWVLVLGDDNYVVTKNVKDALRGHDPAQPHYFAITGCGKGLCDDKKGGACGGGGEILSRGALLKMADAGIAKFFEEHRYYAQNYCKQWSDQTTSCVARHHGVKLQKISGLHGWRQKLEDVQKALKKSRPKPLTFHYVSPSFMLQIHEEWEKISKQQSSTTKKRSLMSARLDRGRGHTLRRFIEIEDRCKYSMHADDAIIGKCLF